MCCTLTLNKEPQREDDKQIVEDVDNKNDRGATDNNRNNKYGYDNLP